MSIPDTSVIESDSGPGTPIDEPLVEDDALIEEISIDGMCGVY